MPKNVPNIVASSLPIGSKRRGNNGKMYIVKQYDSGVIRWSKIDKKSKKNDKPKVKPKVKMENFKVEMDLSYCDEDDNKLDKTITYKYLNSDSEYYSKLKKYEEFAYEMFYGNYEEYISNVKLDKNLKLKFDVKKKDEFKEFDSLKVHIQYHTIDAEGQPGVTVEIYDKDNIFYILKFDNVKIHLK